MIFTWKTKLKINHQLKNRFSSTLQVNFQIKQHVSQQNIQKIAFEKNNIAKLGLALGPKRLPALLTEFTRMVWYGMVEACEGAPVEEAALFVTTPFTEGCDGVKYQTLPPGRSNMLYF